MKYTISKRYHFYAAHRNLALKNKCASLHGHTYKVEVSLEWPGGRPDSETGVLTSFEDIDGAIEPIIAELDHSFIVSKQDPLYTANVLAQPDEEWYAQKIYVLEGPTSVENLCANLFERISKRLPQLARVSIAETESSTVTIEYNHG